MLWAAVLNFLVNALLLSGTLRLTGGSLRPGRVLPAAAVGAAFAAGCLAPGFAFLGGLHWHLAALALMSAAAFGVDAVGRKQGGIFVLMALAVEGLALLAGSGEPWLLLCAGAVRLLSMFALNGRPGRRLIPVEIPCGGSRLCLTALEDTGNELRDPITGEGVLVVGEGCARELTGLTREQLRHPLDTLASGALPGLRLIPYRCIGTEQGMLLAMRLPRVRIGRRDGPQVVAFAPLELGGETYQALTGGVS